MKSNEFMPQILLPTRLTSRSKTLTDNIFVNHYNATTTSGNLTSTVSDHLPQFLVNHNDKRTKINYLGQKSISYLGPSIWNKLPKLIKERVSVNTLSISLRTFT